MTTGRPWSVTIGTDRSRTFSTRPAAIGFATSVLIDCALGTHAVINGPDRYTITLDRVPAFRIVMNFAREPWT